VGEVEIAVVTKQLGRERTVTAMLKLGVCDILMITFLNLLLASKSRSFSVGMSKREPPLVTLRAGMISKRSPAEFKARS